jgi:alpha-amylase/alpha-mannosidase (GH57 family)
VTELGLATSRSWKKKVRPVYFMHKKSAHRIFVRYPQYWISPELILQDEHASEKQQLNTAPGSAKPGERQV